MLQITKRMSKIHYLIKTKAKANKQHMYYYSGFHQQDSFSEGEILIFPISNCSKFLTATLSKFYRIL